MVRSNKVSRVLIHCLRGIPIEAYEIVDRMYSTLFTTKVILMGPLLVMHVIIYRSMCLALAFYICFAMVSALSHAVAHAIIERAALSWISIATFSFGAGAGEAAVQWCIPLFAELSILLITTLYLNTHVLNRCKQSIQHGHHTTSTWPIIKAMGKLTFNLICIMAISLVAAKQPVMNQLLIYYMIIMSFTFLVVYCGVLPLMDCLPPTVLTWPYAPNHDAGGYV